MIRLATVLTTAVLVAIVSGCGPAAATDNGAGTGSTSPAQGKDAFGAVADPGSLVVKSWLDPAQAEISDDPNAEVLEVQTTPNLTPPELVAARWQGTVQALATQSADVVGVGFTDSSEDSAPGAASYALHSAAGFKPDDAASVEATARSGAQKLGLSVTSVEVTDTAAGPAVMLTATPVDGDAIAFATKHRSPAAELDLPGSAVFVQIVDSAGHVVVADASIHKTELEISWASPSVPGCVGIVCPSGDN